MEILKTLAISILGSAAAFGFIQFLISRHDKRNDDLEEIKNSVEYLKGEINKSIKDSVRIQLLVLLILQPDDKKEILDVAHHYFKELKSNWYMSPLFYKWCLKQNIKPEWFHYEEKDEG